MNRKYFFWFQKNRLNWSCTQKITLQDYLRENPDKTEADFLPLKAISDQIYQEQFSRAKAQTRRELPLYDCVKVSVPSA